MNSRSNSNIPISGGVIVQIGIAFAPHNVNPILLQLKKISIAGSLVGGLPETQDCIDFCHKHNIVPKIKLVNSNDLEGVYKDLSSKNDTIIRNVLDIEASKAL